MTAHGASARPLGSLALARTAVDRAAVLRTDEKALAALWADAGTRVFAVADASAVVRDDALVFGPPADAPAGERYFLGTDGTGVAYFAVAVEDLPGATGLRTAGPLLGDRDAGLLVAASALAHWHATHRHCGRCGTATVLHSAGWTRRCPADGSEHYPRTDPAVIMTIVDADDRVLLGRPAHWPAGRYSTLAGFVEAGESLEQAVRREVLEESGVVVGEVSYLGNQPWPFPSSLMLGFTGRAETTGLTLADEELADARWFSRTELADALAAGELLLPGPVSIARRLIEQWYGAGLTVPSESVRA